MKNPWNVPDWRRMEEYPKGKKILPYAWRWEFMRRSKAYRAAWQDFSSDPNPHGYAWRDAEHRTWEEKVAWKFGLFDMLDPSLTSSKVDPGSFSETETYLTKRAFTAAQERWLENSRGAVILRVPGEKKRGVYAGRAQSMHSFEVRTRARGRLLVSIDPNQPLDPQFAAIKKSLAKIPSSSRAHTEAFELYLRLLDARSGDRDSNVSWKEICTTLAKDPRRASFSDIDLVKRRYRTAVQLQERMLQPYYP